MEFNERLKMLMEKNGITKYRLSKETGLSQSTLKYILDGRTNPQPRSVEIMASIFGVSPAYLRGEEDELGLTADDWKMMGVTFASERKLRGKSVEDCADSVTVTVEEVQAFENEGSPLSLRQLDVICGLAGTDARYVFAPWAKTLFETKRSEKAEGLGVLPEGIIRIARNGKSLNAEELEQLNAMAKIMFPGKYGDE